MGVSPPYKLVGSRGYLAKLSYQEKIRPKPRAQVNKTALARMRSSDLENSYGPVNAVPTPVSTTRITHLASKDPGYKPKAVLTLCTSVIQCQSLRYSTQTLITLFV